MAKTTTLYLDHPFISSQLARSHFNQINGPLNLFIQRTISDTIELKRYVNNTYANRPDKKPRKIRVGFFCLNATKKQSKQIEKIIRTTEEDFSYLILQPNFIQDFINFEDSRKSARIRKSIPYSKFTRTYLDPIINELTQFLIQRQSTDLTVINNVAIKLKCARELWLAIRILALTSKKHQKLLSNQLEKTLFKTR